MHNDSRIIRPKTDIQLPSTHTGIRGEYRAVLRNGGAEGNIKYDSGWQPNMILDQGPYLMIQHSNYYSWLALGDSDAAVASTQTGIQGNFLGAQSRVAYQGTRSFNSTVAPYYGFTQYPYVFDLGEGTGTIKEAVMTGDNDLAAAQNEAVLRIVLAAPIVKGPNDHLTIEHRMYVYPDVTPKSGTFDVSGTNYDWEMMYSNIDAIGYGESWGAPSVYIDAFTGPVKTLFGDLKETMYLNGVMPVDVFSRPTGDPASGDAGWATQSNSFNPGPPPYRQIILSAGLDEGNGTFDMFELDHNGDPYGAHWAGRTIKITRTSDSAPFTKEDTHVVTFTFRMYLDKYTP